MTKRIKWNKKIQNRLTELYKEGGTNYKIAEILSKEFKTNITYKSTENALARFVLGKDGIKRGPNTINTQSWSDKLIETFDLALQKVKPPKKPKLRTSKKYDSEVAVAIISDTQIGQKTPFAHTMGITEYSYKIFKERFWRHITAIKRLNGIYTHAIPCNHLVIILAGDMGEGETIFPGQAGKIDLNATEQLVFGAQQMALGINELCGEYQKVEVIGVPGNHGRIGKKGEAQGNLDILFYHMLATQIAAENCKIYISDSMACVVEINKKNFLVSHGDSIRGWMGLPFYGAERATRRLADITGVHLDYAVYAHHHQAAQIPVGFIGVIFNGAYPGGSDFSVNKLHSASFPMQKYFYVHKEKGITAHWNINLAPGVRGIQVVPTGPVLTPAHRVQ